MLDKEDEPKTGADWHYERFVNDNIEGYWQYGKFQVYKRKYVLPRIFLTTNYYVAKSDKEIIEKIYDQNFSLQTLILEKEPPIKISPVEEEIFEPQLVKYEPNEIKITTNYDYNSLLFISDAFDPDWQVYLDGKPWQLLRAHYALRSTPVPKGKHLIIFKYQPKSFNIVYTTCHIILSSARIFLEPKFRLYSHFRHSTCHLPTPRAALISPFSIVIVKEADTMINNYGYGEALAYNVIAGTLPKCLQMDTIGAIFSEKLRHLPTKSGFFIANGKSVTSTTAGQNMTKTKPKMVWHLNKKRKYFTLPRTLAKRAHLFLVF